MMFQSGKLRLQEKGFFAVSRFRAKDTTEPLSEWRKHLYIYHNNFMVLYFDGNVLR